MNLHLGVHAGTEQALLVPDAYEHRKHGDVLLGLRLWLDLEHGPGEGAIGEGVDRHGGALPGLDLPDVGLVDQCPHLHQAEVRHLHQRGAAAHVRGRRRDHLAPLGTLLDDRSRDGGTNIGVLELDARVVHRHL